jgi:exonuclease SbcC
VREGLVIRRIILENYMSHARTVIEPAAGLTVLVGPNNCGKSAVVSALQTLCGDNAGDFMVRHGERVSQVTVETDDGHVITWRRKGAAVMYVIDGREVHRSGRGNLPDDLHDHLRLPKVEAGSTGEKFDVHFALQKSPIFLIDNEGRAASFFSTSSDAERLLEVQKLHKAKVAEARASQKNLAAEHKRLGERLEVLAPLDGINDALKGAEAEYNDLLADTAEMSDRAGVIAALARCRQTHSGYHRRCAALAPLSPPPELAATRPLEERIESLDRAAKQIARHRSARDALSALRSLPEMADVTRLEETILGVVGWGAAVDGRRRQCGLLEPLADPPVLRDDQPLARLCGRLDEVQERRRRALGVKAALEELHEPPALRPTDGLETLVRRLRQAETAARHAGNRFSAVAALPEPPDVVDTSPLEQLIRRRGAADGAVAGQRAALNRLDAELGEVVARARQWSERNPSCPICGAATDAERILAGGHSHA